MLRITALLCLFMLSLQAVDLTISEVKAEIHDQLPYAGVPMHYGIDGAVVQAPPGQRLIAIRALLHADNWASDERFVNIDGPDISLTSNDGEALKIVGKFDAFGAVISSIRLRIRVAQSNRSDAHPEQYVNLVAVVGDDFVTGQLRIGKATAPVLLNDATVPPRLPLQAEVLQTERLSTVVAQDQRLPDISLALTPSSGSVLRLQLAWTVTGHIHAEAAGPGIMAIWDTSDISLRLANGSTLPVVATQSYRRDQPLGVRLGSSGVSVNRPDLNQHAWTQDIYFIIPDGSTQGKLFLGYQEIQSAVIPQEYAE